MTSIAIVFVAAACLSLLLTPPVIALARRLRIVDRPAARKVHRGETPRTGGIAIYFAVVLPFVAVLLGQGVGTEAYGKVVALLIGASIAFGVGVADDVRSLPPRCKLLLQILAALIAFSGGIQIENAGLPVVGEVFLGWAALPVTVFWFLLIINGLNLIDGLDGLAAGITFFASLILLIVWGNAGTTAVGLALAALAGATLGFLRYNFHPASVFLGDGGSYFLGYTLAALSILGSIKSEATVAILIPVIALGVPVIDTVWAPLRRFILGQRLFHPDMDHIHHRLLKLGYTQRRAVLLLYAITIIMGAAALSLVHAKDERAAGILILVAAGVITGIRRLGYMTFIHFERFVGWLNAVGDEIGLRRSRRTFLDSQISISQSGSVEELWQRVWRTAGSLDVDYCALTVKETQWNGQATGGAFRHSRHGHADVSQLDHSGMLYISLPLFDPMEQIGFFVVAKAMRCATSEPFIFRRIDQLRGTIEETLLRLRAAPLESAYSTPSITMQNRLELAGSAYEDPRL